MTWREQMVQTIREQLAIWGRPVLLTLNEAGAFSTATLTRDNQVPVPVPLRAVRALERNARAANPAGEESQWEVTYKIVAEDLGDNREPREGDELAEFTDEGALVETFQVTGIEGVADRAGILLRCRRFT